MPRSFDPDFLTELARVTDRFSPAPFKAWTARILFGAPTGPFYFSTGRQMVVDGLEYLGQIVSIGDFSSLIDRSDPLRLDVNNIDLELSNLPDPISDVRFSNYLGRDFEATPIEIDLIFEKLDASFIAQTIFKGFASSPVKYGYRTITIPILSPINKYFSVQALRILDDQTFKYIRSSDNGKGVPIIIGKHVRRAPGRAVKARTWTDPQAAQSNVLSGALHSIVVTQTGIDSEYFEDVTVTFTSSTLYTVESSTRGTLGTVGDINGDFVESDNPAFRIPSSAWSGTFQAGEIFTFSIDTRKVSEVVFSESPSETPIADLFQLYWGDYPVVSGYSVVQSAVDGVPISFGTKTDNSGKSTSLDAPDVEFNSAFYGTADDGMLAGRYEYLYVYDPGPSGANESGPSGTAEIDLKDPLVPLPPPANPPSVAINSASPYSAGNVDKGAHRWALTYVSAYGETTIGQSTQPFDVIKNFIDPPPVEPQITFESTGGQLFLSDQESARSWVYTWADAYGNETTPSPARSVQVLDLPAFGIVAGVVIPAAPDITVTLAHIYRTIYVGGGAYPQLTESAKYYRIGTIAVTTAHEVKFIDDGSMNSALGGIEPPSVNNSGVAANIDLSDIAIGPPGTVARRLYRTTNDDNGPFKFVAELDNPSSSYGGWLGGGHLGSTYLDAKSDAIVEDQTASISPPDYRTDQPLLPLDADLSGDKSHMVCTSLVTIPVIRWEPSVSAGYIRVYRSKRDKSGTHYFHSQHVYSNAEIVFVDDVPDADLGGLAPNERPPSSSSGQAPDTFSAYAMRIDNPKPLLARSLGLMFSKTGNPNGDVQLQILGDAAGQPTGNTIASVTLRAEDITGAIVSHESRLDAAIVIPPGIVWFKVDTPAADPDNYYSLGYTTSALSNAVLYAKSSQQDKWTVQVGSLGFSINGSVFTLDPQIDDGSGHLTAKATLDVEIPNDVLVTCDASGITDDVSGSYSGVASAIIELPGDVVKWFAHSIGGVPFDEIDIAGTFAATNEKYGILYRLKGVVQDAQTLLALLLRIGLETRSIPDWSFDKLEWKFLPASITDQLPEPSVIISRSDIVLESNEPDAQPKLEIQRLGTEKVINSIDLNWARKAWIQPSTTRDGKNIAYARVTSGEDSESVELYGKLTRGDLFNFDFIADEDTAVDLVAFYLSRNGTPDKTQVTLTLSAAFLSVEKDDIVAFAIDQSLFGEGNFGEGVFGGLALYDSLIRGSLFQVEGKTVHPDVTIELVLREL